MMLCCEMTELSFLFIYIIFTLFIAIFSHNINILH